MNYPHVSTMNDESNIVPLQGVQADGEVNELFSIVAITQTYKNVERRNIESVYTFPLPVDAVLLNLRVTVGERIMSGVVSRKNVAEEQYETAIEHGKSAVMLENPRPEMYTMSLGNLMPGEIATIRYQYVQMNDWTGDGLRFFLPTTIAPRYGDPGKGGMQGHQVPDYSLAHENRMSITLSVVGSLRESAITSPSHKISITHAEGKTVISAQGISSGHVPMDRDFILNVRPNKMITSAAFFEKSEDEYVVMASYLSNMSDNKDPCSRCVSIVVDCSGSMGGDSIDQARAALHDILQTLRKQDYFNIVTFGSDHHMLFTSPRKANDDNIRLAARLATGLSANLGGTEIGNAIEATLCSAVPEGMSHDLLLITDGEVWDDAAIIQSVLKHKCRVFTVGVGSSVSETFVRNLARSTGGACELASPGEGMSGKIVAQFRRILTDKVDAFSVSWPFEAESTYPEGVKTIYYGDTVRTFAKGKGKPSGEVRFNVSARGETVTTVVECSELPKTLLTHADDSQSVLARLMAASIVRDAGSADDVVEEMAVRYNLMSRMTNYILTMEREGCEEGCELPIIRKVPQTLAAGWHGMGRVMAESRMNVSLSKPMYSLRRRSSSMPPVCSAEAHEDGYVFDENEFEIPSFDRGCSNNCPERSMSMFVSNFNSKHPMSAQYLCCLTFVELNRLDLPVAVLESLAAMEKDDNETTLVLAFLSALAGMRMWGAINRHAKRLVRAQAKKAHVPQKLIDRMGRMLLRTCRD